MFITPPSATSVDMAYNERDSPGPLEHVQDFIEEGKWRKDRAARMKTPTRRAILDVENAPEKRKLRRDQQILTDLSRRVREHEVHLLSDGISAPILPRLSPRFEVFLRAHTTTPATPFLKSRATTTTGDRIKNFSAPLVNPRITTTSTPVGYEGLKREPNFTRTGGLAGSTQVHKSFSGRPRANSTPLETTESGRIRFAKGVHFGNANNRNRLLYSRDINGPVQLHLYTQRRPHMQPLVVRAFRHDLPNDLNRVETFVNSRPVSLAQKNNQKPNMYSTLRCNPRPSPEAEFDNSGENPISSW